MEHEVFVPVAAERLREALADPARVARAVPGLQQEAGAEPVAGRLKVRIGSTSITYRGALRITPREDGAYAVEGDATEARGSGSVKVALTLRVRAAEGGAVLAVTGTADADGRVTELPEGPVGTAVTRLLNRFGERLGTESVGSVATEDFQPSASGDFEAAPDADDAEVPPPAETSVYEAEVPPPSLDPDESDQEPADTDTDTDSDTDTGADAEPPAEAAHARRTMIGRSAEEVDHAPPRGRYAPVPAPQAGTPVGAALRWAAPAAAVVLASIVVGRVLRKRR
ncbi:SRPBCC domain-containing protein [Streptomyces sp. NPDC006997]|uniref:SRPBCC domain-containing protein n=1 Tax=Streptomyces sp. NPDC006997 TaxID=3155356 RepID=UPI0033CBD1E9